MPHIKILICVTILLLFSSTAQSQRSRRPPTGGRLAVVIDERLSALRSAPDLSGKLLQRVSRGRLVAITGRRTTAEGIVFYRVNLTSRTRGWIQQDAVASPGIPEDESRLLKLIRTSEDFDRLARAQIFLTNFPRSRFRSAVLLIYADTAEAAAEKLSRDAARRLDHKDLSAPEVSYFLNYSGLDRYNRQGVNFIFDRRTKKFHYDGKAWREIIRRYPRSVEALEARNRLRE